MGLASIMDQMQLSYLSAQNVIEAMEELATSDQPQSALDMNQTTKQDEKTPATQRKAGKPILTNPPKKGIFQVFETISKSHLNTRLWIRSRLNLAQYMLNQLIDAGKVKGLPF